MHLVGYLYYWQLGFNSMFKGLTLNFSNKKNYQPFDIENSICSFTKCSTSHFNYRSADKSLARPERKQARKHVRDARDFNNIETRAVITFFFFVARQGAEGNWRHSDRNISLFPFLVGLRTYQHPCMCVDWVFCLEHVVATRECRVKLLVSMLLNVNFTETFVILVCFMLYGLFAQWQEGQQLEARDSSLYCQL